MYNAKIFNCFIKVILIYRISGIASMNLIYLYYKKAKKADDL